MSLQFNNNFITALTSPNSYVTRRLNNIDEAKLFKREQNDWIKLYHKILQGIEAMIDVQRQVKNIMKIAEETNTMITEMEGNILKTSVNNQIMNMMNILGISEDLQTLIQSDMEN